MARDAGGRWTMSSVTGRHVPETMDRTVIICALSVKDDRFNVTDSALNGIISLVGEGRANCTPRPREAPAGAGARDYRINKKPNPLFVSK